MQDALNILHLEDNQLDAELIRETLTAQGIVANISPLQTEEEFRSSLGNGNVDLILADYSLPGFNGMTALAIVRENRPDLPFIFVSGTIGEENAIDGLKSGATDYVFKHRLQRLGLSVRRALSEVEERLRRKVADEALRESEARYRRLFESAKDGILILDAGSGQIVDVNPYLIEMLGFSKEEFVGKELWQIGLFKDVAASRLAFTELQQRGYIRYEDLPLETREGLVRPVEFVSNIYLEGESQVIQCNIRDITERKRFEQTLREKNIELGNANLAKDRFLANMSHELRTPLNAIIGFTGTLLMGLPGPLNADQEHQLSIVQTGARHLLSLINDLLDLARVESGKVEIKYEPLVCQDVVEEVAAALRPLAEGKGLEFKIKAPKSSVRIAADRRILSQILINLSNNAIKFTEEGQVRIRLRTRQSNGQTLASIEVIDTGIGIRIEDQEKLFQAFQQVRADHRSEGTGLGLYLSQKLAILIKGKIEFESEYGKGSTFRLLIPTA
jgi:protein-histidine pros-kinase